MNDKFAKKIEKFLLSECSDYDLEYKWEFSPDENGVNVTIFRNKDCHNPFEEIFFFQYDEENEELKIEMYEDSFETVTNFDWRVKFLWMKLAPYAFPAN